MKHLLLFSMITSYAMASDLEKSFQSTKRHPSLASESSDSSVSGNQSFEYEEKALNYKLRDELKTAITSLDKIARFPSKEVERTKLIRQIVQLYKKISLTHEKYLQDYFVDLLSLNFQDVKFFGEELLRAYEGHGMHNTMIQSANKNFCSQGIQNFPTFQSNELKKLRALLSEKNKNQNIPQNILQNDLLKDLEYYENSQDLDEQQSAQNMKKLTELQNFQVMRIPYLTETSLLITELKLNPSIISMEYSQHLSDILKELSVISQNFTDLMKKEGPMVEVLRHPGNLNYPKLSISTMKKSIYQSQIGREIARLKTELNTLIKRYNQEQKAAEKEGTLQELEKERNAFQPKINEKSKLIMKNNSRQGTLYERDKEWLRAKNEKLEKARAAQAYQPENTFKPNITRKYYKPFELKKKLIQERLKVNWKNMMMLMRQCIGCPQSINVFNGRLFANIMRDKGLHRTSAVLF